MRAVVLVDTSVFCEILDVPNKSTRPLEFRREVQNRRKRKETLLLPLATLLETGNHIGQNGDGRQRRATAERFVDQVRLAIEGKSPFSPISPLEIAHIGRWLDEFPDCAMEGMGIGDLSIIHEWQKQCEMHPHRRVLIWSLDKHLSGYDTGER